MQNQINTLAKLLDTLKEFECKDNDDIVAFISDNAIETEGRGDRRTFLVIDEDKLDNNTYKLEAFFTLALKPFKITNGESLSKTQYRKFKEADNDGVKNVSAYLIGQLARNDLCDKNDLPGSFLFSEIYALIKKAQRIVGGTAILLECENKKDLIKRYKKEMFKVIQSVESDSSLIQMYRFL